MSDGRHTSPPRAWWCLSAFLGAFSLCLLWVPLRAAPSPAEPFRYTGPGSCSSPACHGSVRPRTETRIWQNEYSIWAVKDKHSRAWQVLTQPVARRMGQILGIGPAEKAPECLACHALDVPADARGRTFDLSDGVSCESCHGPASAWLGEHTTKGWTHEQSLALGMYDTRDLVKRTEKCLGCHLGGKEKFVDHEMLAAGHPDLYFELDSFSAVMPRHWKEPLDQDPWRGVREWGTGQAVQLRGSLERLVVRAQGANWPEYSELDCFACHHSLTAAADSWRQERGYTGRRAGDPPWNRSRDETFGVLVAQVDPEGARKLEASLDALAVEMDRLVPDRDKVVREANASIQVLDGLDGRLASLGYDSAFTLRLLKAISADANAISDAGERSAEQAAMALDSVFLCYSRKEKVANESEIRAAINGLFQQLENPSGYNAFLFARQMKKVNSLLR